MTTRNAAPSPRPAAEAVARLHALAARVDTITSLRSTMTKRGLMVLRPDDGAEKDFGPNELVDCRPRDDANGELWFFQEDGEPIAPADDVSGALLWLLGALKP